jgi:hypothetical protein
MLTDQHLLSVCLCAQSEGNRLLDLMDCSMLAVGCRGSMPDKIDLTNVTGIKYEPSISSCWTGSGTIIIQSNHQVQLPFQYAHRRPQG